jgi:hypothetical protein
MFPSYLSLNSDEHFVRSVRPHEITYTLRFLVSLLFIALSFFLLFWFFSKGMFGYIGFAFLLGFGLLMLFQTWYIRRHRAWHITSNRLIDVDQQGFFKRVVSDLSHDQIEDVAGDIRGFAGTVLGYGTVEVRSSAGTVILLLERVKKPTQLQQQIHAVRRAQLRDEVIDVEGRIKRIQRDIRELDEHEVRRVHRYIHQRLKKIRRQE